MKTASDVENSKNQPIAFSISSLQCHDLLTLYPNDEIGNLHVNRVVFMGPSAFPFGGENIVLNVNVFFAEI